MGDGIGHGGVQRREEICGDGGADGEDLIAGSGVLAVVGKVGRGIADAGEGRFAGLAVLVNERFSTTPSRQFVATEESIVE